MLLQSKQFVWVGISERGGEERTRKFCSCLINDNKSQGTLMTTDTPTNSCVELASPVAEPAGVSGGRDCTFGEQRSASSTRLGRANRSQPGNRFFFQADLLSQSKAHFEKHRLSEFSGWGRDGSHSPGIVKDRVDVGSCSSWSIHAKICLQNNDAKQLANKDIARFPAAIKHLAITPRYNTTWEKPSISGRMLFEFDCYWRVLDEGANHGDTSIRTRVIGRSKKRYL